MSIAKVIALMGGVGSAVFVTEHGQYMSGSSLALSLSGAQAGDLALIFGLGISNTPPSGWTLVFDQLLNTAHRVVFSKVLTSGDISTGSVTVSGAANQPVAVAIYRGATTATKVASTSDNTTDVTVSGVTKAAGCRGIVTAAICGESTANPTAPVESGGATQRVSLTGGSSALGTADYLPSIRYANGTSLTWTDVATGVFGASVLIIELT